MKKVRLSVFQCFQILEQFQEWKTSMCVSVCMLCERETEREIEIKKKFQEQETMKSGQTNQENSQMKFQKMKKNVEINYSVNIRLDTIK